MRVEYATIPLIMSKRNTIIYWVSTLWLALGMLSSGIVQVLKLQTEVDFITHLGYPVYFLMLLGVWKILGVIVILIPKRPLWKEWAYAGFFFTMSGALFSHLAVGGPITELFPATLLLFLTVVSYCFRPQDRKIVQAKA